MTDYTITPDEARNTLSDLHKDVTGVRPHGLNVNAMSDEAVVEMYRGLVVELGQVQEEEAAAEVVAIKEFEVLVAKTMTANAIPRETAVRWLMEAEDVNMEDNFFCYTQGLPYGYFPSA